MALTRLLGSSTHGAHAASAPVGAATGPPSYGPPPLAIYTEKSPHVDSTLNAYGVQGMVRGASAAPPSTLPPLAAGAFTAPEAAYRAYAAHQLTLMLTQTDALSSALAAGDRGGAQQAWRQAFADYLRLGAVYLEGPLAALNRAIDGTSGGLAGGTSSPRFSGLHRLELGLWTNVALSRLRPWAQRLSSSVLALRRTLPSVTIAPLDYATRSHEILEDAARDLLSGADVPWSGEGVLGTEAGLAATTEVVHTLAPLLQTREGVLPVVQAELRSLRATMASINRAHGGVAPTNGQLTQMQSERLDGSLGQALEALAQVPGALETTTPPATPTIPRAAVKIDP